MTPPHPAGSAAPVGPARSGLTAEVVDGLAAEWPGLVGDGPLFATPGWLRAMDGRLGGRTVTVLVRRDGQAVLAAFASVQDVPRPGEVFDPHEMLLKPNPDVPLTPAATAVRAEVSATLEWAPSLVLMLPGYECTPVGPAHADPDAALALVDAALEWAGRNGIPTVAALYTRPEATALTTALTARGFVAGPLPPTWELRLPGTGLDDYLAHLPHKRRIEARRELRLLDRNGVRITPVDAHAAFDTLVDLRCRLVAKYRGGRHDPAAERRRLRHIVDDVAAGHPHVLLATADDTPLGFALFAGHAGVWHCLAVGTDYDDPRSRLTYFATAYYRAAEHAYANGIRTIGYGIGVRQVKQARGCTPVPLTGWAHSTDPATAAALHAIAIAG